MIERFLDNKLYGAGDLNIIPALLGGVLMSKFLDGQTYGTADLNDITASLVGAGVLQGGGNLQVSVIGQGGGAVARVASGSAVLNSGATITLDAPVDFPLPPNAATFVYAEHDAALNIIRVNMSETAPSGDFVPLAEISAFWQVTDRRTFSRAKFNGIGGNTARQVNRSTVDPWVSNFDISPFNYVVGFGTSGNGNGRFFIYDLRTSGGVNVMSVGWEVGNLRNTIVFTDAANSRIYNGGRHETLSGMLRRDGNAVRVERTGGAVNATEFTLLFV